MFDLIIMAQDGKMEPKQIEKITIPTSDGQRTILSRHMEVFIEVDIGVVSITTKEGVERYAVSGGIFHFKNNVADLIVTSFENEHEIDHERARLAYERAQEMLNNEKNKDEMRKAEHALKRALTRLNLE